MQQVIGQLVDLSAQSITFRTNKGIPKDAGYKALEGAVAKRAVAKLQII